MNKPTVRIYQGNAEYIDREMNDTEFAQYNSDKAAQVIANAQAEARAQAKATAEGKLAALGLTTDDLRALGL